MCKGKDTTQTGNGVMFDVTSYPACGSVGPESGLSSFGVCCKKVDFIEEKSPLMNLLTPRTYSLGRV